MKKLFSIIVALLISLFIYVFYRSEKTLVNELLTLLLPLETYLKTKASVANAVALNEHIIFSLPGGLWVFCVTVLARDFYTRVRNYKLQMTIVPIVFALGLEFCQLLHITRGTFDIWDVTFLFIFWCLGYFSFRSHQIQKDILAPFTLPSFMCLACFLSVYLAHLSQ